MALFIVLKTRLLAAIQDLERREPSSQKSFANALQVFYRRAESMTF